MPRPRQRHRLHALARGLAVGRPGAHPPPPVVVVAIPDNERERRAERPALPQAGEHLDGVGFDALPRTSAVALLPAPEIGVDGAAIEDEARGQARHDRDERRAVRLARGNELEHQAERTAACMTSTGADTPVQSSNDAEPWATSTSNPSTTRAPRAPAARPVAVAGYGRSISVCPAPSSTRTLWRSEVALTTRAASLTSGGQSPRREKRAASGTAAANAAAAPPSPRIAARSNSRPPRTAASVLHPLSRPSRTTRVFTDATSAPTSRAAASLCGVVTFAPTSPSATSPRSASSSASAATRSAT